MCMGAGWGGLDGQYVVGDMIGGRVGKELSRSSASNTLAKHGSPDPDKAPAVQNQALQQTETRQSRQGKSLLSS